MRQLFVIMIFFIWACDSKPKVVVEDTAATQNTGAMPSGNPAMTVAGQDNANDATVHQVQALEILQAGDILTCG